MYNYWKKLLKGICRGPRTHLTHRPFKAYFWQGISGKYSNFYMCDLSLSRFILWPGALAIEDELFGINYILLALECAVFGIELFMTQYKIAPASPSLIIIIVIVIIIIITIITIIYYYGYCDNAVVGVHYNETVLIRSCQQKLNLCWISNGRLELK